MAVAAPRLSEFYGIAIEMFHTDHGVPHFHARYGDFKAVFRTEPFQIPRGRLARRAEAFVAEWAALHRIELMDNWNRGRSLAPMVPNAPLD